MKRKLGSVQQALRRLQVPKGNYQKSCYIPNIKCDEDRIYVANAYATFASLQPKQLKTMQLGSDHPDVGTPYDNQVSLYQPFVELKDSTHYYEKSLDIDNVQRPLYQAFVDRRIAETYYQKSLDTRIQQLGPVHISVADSYDKLGSLYEACGNLRVAEVYYQKSLNIRIKQLGPFHLDVANSYDKLGSLYEALDDLHTAEDYYQKSLNIRITQLAPDNIRVANCIKRLACLDKPINVASPAIQCTLGHSDFTHLPDLQSLHQKVWIFKTKQLNPEDNPQICKTHPSLHESVGDLKINSQPHEKASRAPYTVKSNEIYRGKSNHRQPRHTIHLYMYFIYLYYNLKILCYLLFGRSVLFVRPQGVFETEKNSSLIRTDNKW